MEHKNKQSYNKIADQWHEARSPSPINKCIVDVAALIKPGGKILDIGCGTGQPIAEYLSKQGFSVTGIDIADNLLCKAKNLNLPNAQFLLCDFFAFQPAEKYDGIIAFDSFFHFPMQRQPEIYKRLSRWMNIGAYLLFTHGKTTGEIKGAMYGEDFYYSSLSTRDVQSLLNDNGFSIELSIEDYEETSTGQRDLLIVAKRIPHESK